VLTAHVEEELFFLKNPFLLLELLCGPPDVSSMMKYPGESSEFIILLMEKQVHMINWLFVEARCNF